jgi:hypothetical protein
MNDLKKLLGKNNIVESYTEAYAFPARIRNKSIFLEDRLTVWVDEPHREDLL